MVRTCARALLRASTRAAEELSKGLAVRQGVVAGCLVRSGFVALPVPPRVLRAAYPVGAGWLPFSALLTHCMFAAAKSSTK